MKMMDCVEVVVEKNKYAKVGVHKGMQGVIWESDCKNGAWVVLIPRCGEKEDIADLYIERLKADSGYERCRKRRNQSPI